MSYILIRAGSVEMLAELNETETAKQLLKALPIKSSAQVWGEEVYFSTNLQLPEHDPQAHVPPGTVAYWLPGKAVCLFFGQAPASPVTIIGEMRGNPYDLAAVKTGIDISLEPAPEALGQRQGSSETD